MIGYKPPGFGQPTGPARQLPAQPPAGLPFATVRPPAQLPAPTLQAFPQLAQRRAIAPVQTLLNQQQTAQDRLNFDPATRQQVLNTGRQLGFLPPGQDFSQYPTRHIATYIRRGMEPDFDKGGVGQALRTWVPIAAGLALGGQGLIGQFAGDATGRLASALMNVRR